MIKKVKDIAKGQNEFFKTQKTKNVDFRIEQSKYLKDQ
jgi:hypothetical protein